MTLPWRPQAVVFNLEGPLVARSPELLRATVLFNDPSVLLALEGIGARVAGLANNHTLDSGGELSRTKDRLAEHGIDSLGAGTDLASASAPVRHCGALRDYVLLAFGWSPIGCRRPRRDSVGINPLSPVHVLRSVREWRARAPNAVVVLLMHWNYELELYPQPAHRQLAFSAIEHGADAVIGHHPHRVGGLEMYDGHPIVYSTGNWWMPQGVYFDGRLGFPEVSSLQLALEWRCGSQPRAHWFRYESDPHHLAYLESEAVEDSKRIAAYTPFAGLTHDEYQEWFKEHRIQRKGLPIYRDFRHRVRNRLKDGLVRLRHVAVVGVNRSGFRSWGRT